MLIPDMSVYCYTGATVQKDSDRVGPFVENRFRFIHVCCLMMPKCSTEF